MAKAIHKLTEQSPLERDMIPIERESTTSPGIYSGYWLSAESLMKSHLAGKGVNLADYKYSMLHSSMPSPWVTATWSGTRNVVADITAEGGYRLDLTNDGETKTYTQQLGLPYSTTGTPYEDYPIKLTPGKQYLVSSLVRTDEAEEMFAKVGLAFKNSSGDIESVSNATYQIVTDEWNAISLIIEVPSDKDRAAFVVTALKSSGSGTVQFCGFMVEEYIGDGTNDIPSTYVPPIYIP